MSSIENYNKNQNLLNNSKQIDDTLIDNNVDILNDDESNSRTREIETITDICCSDNLPEVQLISLLDEEIPLYKLRADTLFSHNNSDWVQAPLFIDEQELVDLDNEQLRLTLDYFILSGFRVSQMTKTYYDIEACNKLLQEKERDVELAATIGKTLLDKNQSLEDKIQNLELQLEKTKDMVNQLSYELNLKEDLLKNFIEFENERHLELETCSQNRQQRDSNESSNRTYLALDHQNEYDSSKELDSLRRRISSLEDKNSSLKCDFDYYFSESNNRSKCLDDDIHQQKSDNETLIRNYSREIADANSKIESIQEELRQKTRESNQQQDDIDHLYDQIVELQERIKTLLVENEELKSIILNAASNQQILVQEISDLRLKYNECCDVLRVTQEELNEVRRKYSKRSEIRQLRYQQLYSPWHQTHTANSFAFELQKQQEQELKVNLFKEKQKAFEFVKSVKERLIRSSVSMHQTNVDSCFQSDSDFESSTRTTTGIVDMCQTPDSLLTSSIISSTSGLSHSKQKRSFLPDKIQILKPIEGSHTLQHWQQLSKPNLGCVLEPRPGIYLPKGDTIHEIDDSEDADTESIEDELDYEYDDCCEPIEASSMREHTPIKEINKEFTSAQVKLLEKLLKSSETSPIQSTPVPTSTSPTLINKLNEIKNITSKYYNLNQLNIKIDRYQFKNLDIYDKLSRINLLGKINKKPKATDTPPSSPINCQIDPTTPPGTPTKDFERLYNHEKQLDQNDFHDELKCTSYFSQIVNKLKCFTNTITSTHHVTSDLIKPKPIKMVSHQQPAKTSTPPPSPTQVLIENNDYTQLKNVKSAFKKIPQLNSLIEKRDENNSDHEKPSTPPSSPNFTFDNADDVQLDGAESTFLKITQLNPYLNKSIDLANLLGSVSNLKRTNKL